MLAITPQGHNVGDGQVMPVAAPAGIYDSSKVASRPSRNLECRIWTSGILIAALDWSQIGTDHLLHY